jgi:hypothetical protein
MPQLYLRPILDWQEVKVALLCHDAAMVVGLVLLWWGRSSFVFQNFVMGRDFSRIHHPGRIESIFTKEVFVQVNNYQTNFGHSISSIGLLDGFYLHDKCKQLPKSGASHRL